MIVAVAGGKGGVGKSTTAWNLGYELDAVVVDADLTAPDLPPGTGPDLHDVLAGRADPLEAVDTVGTVSVVPCGRTLAGARASELGELEPALRCLERERGRVVVDCPAGLARDVGAVLRSADLVTLVTTPGAPAIVDALKTRELATALRTPVGAAVLNAADREAHGDVADRLGRRLGVEVTIVERRPAVADARARWRPVREHAPAVRAADVYRSVADRLERAHASRFRRLDPV